MCIYENRRQSQLTVWKWLQSIDCNLRWTLLILTQLSVIMFSYLIYVIIELCTHVEFKIVQTNTMMAYLVLSVLYILLVSSISIRVMRISLHRTEEELETKKSFVRYISHEIRTPLSIILTGIDVLEEQLKGGDDIVEILQTVDDLKQPCLSGIQLLNDLLEYEKLDSGLEKLDISAQDPSQMIEATLAPFHAAARLREIELRVENHLSSNSHEVRMDERKVRKSHFFRYFYTMCIQVAQVLVNFLTNALKFTPVGGTIQVHAFADNVNFHVEVIDSGSGVSQDNLKRLFNEAGCFRTTADHSGGAGLGLWISKKIVDLHGGTIGVTSAGEGMGSTFFFTLPVKENERRLSLVNEPRRSIGSSGKRSRVQPESTAPSDLLTGSKVLIVDDSGLIRKMLTNRFEKEGCIVQQAEDGDVALEIMRQSIASDAKQFDVITMDNVIFN